MKNVWQIFLVGLEFTLAIITALVIALFFVIIIGW